jgi:hypothetical protein
VSSPSDPQPPVETGKGSQPSTQEIPVVQPATGATATQQLPPHPGAITPPTVPPMEAPAPTGPVDFVPGLPGLGTPPPPPPPLAAQAQPPYQPATAPAPGPDAGPVWPETLESDTLAPTARGRMPRMRAPQNRAALVGVGLVVLSAVLLEIGLALDFGAEAYWSTVPLWSAFATLCVLLGLLAFAAVYRAGSRLRAGAIWRVAAGGLVGLAVFWLLVVLPVVDTDRGFVLTAALATLGGALWIGPRRKV